MPAGGRDRGEMMVSIGIGGAMVALFHCLADGSSMPTTMLLSPKFHGLITDHNMPTMVALGGLPCEENGDVVSEGEHKLAKLEEGKIPILRSYVGVIEKERDEDTYLLTYSFLPPLGKS
jgi:hypothetical protein